MILITEIVSGCLDKNERKRWYKIFSSCPCIYKEDRKDENNCRPIIYRSFKNMKDVCNKKLMKINFIKILM